MNELTVQFQALLPLTPDQNCHTEELTSRQSAGSAATISCIGTLLKKPFRGDQKTNSTRISACLSPNPIDSRATKTLVASAFKYGAVEDSKALALGRIIPSAVMPGECASNSSSKKGNFLSLNLKFEENFFEKVGRVCHLAIQAPDRNRHLTH